MNYIFYISYLKVIVTFYHLKPVSKWSRKSEIVFEPTGYLLSPVNSVSVNVFMDLFGLLWYLSA